jgi:hypothetical protein
MPYPAGATVDQHAWPGDGRAINKSFPGRDEDQRQGGCHTRMPMFLGLGARSLASTAANSAKDPCSPPTRPSCR